MDISSGDSLRIQYDDGDAVLNLDYIECYSDVIAGAVINPVSAAFDKTHPADVNTIVEWNDAGLITGIKTAGAAIGASNYSVSGSTLTRKKEYLAAKADGELALTIEFDRGAPATLTVTVSKSAALSSATRTFDKTYQADVTANITWNNASSVTDVRVYGVTIGAENYSVSGSTLTIKKEFLATRAYGNLLLNVMFDKGMPASFTIAITESASITPAASTFDKNPDYQTFVAVLIAWYSASSVTDVKADGSSIGAENYYVLMSTPNTLIIKKEYLAEKPLGDLVLTIEFDRGAPATITITVTDTTQEAVELPFIITSVSSSVSDGVLNITANIVNSGSTDTEAVAIIAVFDSSDRMVGIKTFPALYRRDAPTPVSYPYPCGGRTGLYFKVFVFDKTNNIRPLSEVFISK